LRAILIHLVFTGLLAACGDEPSGPDRIALAGVIVQGDAPSRVEIPGTYSVGEPVTVTIDTYGLWGCTSFGETVVERVSPLLVEVTPVDLYEILKPDAACPSRSKDLRHVASITFDGPGEARIVVRGRRLPAGAWWTDAGDEVRVERTLRVRTD
jgi:hypothetical protein